MSSTSIMIIVGILILHFLVGVGFLIYKISGGKNKIKKGE